MDLNVSIKRTYVCINRTVFIQYLCVDEGAQVPPTCRSTCGTFRGTTFMNFYE